MTRFRRPPTHAGSWYSADKVELQQQLRQWLDAVDITSKDRRPVVLISPHAGYRFSGETAAHGFAHLRHLEPRPKRIFVLGPSHCGYFQHCALTMCQTYETPLGSFKVDQEVITDLKKSGLFMEMEQEWEWEEHSLEMQLPMLYEALHEDGGAEMPILVPVLVGAISDGQEAAYGRCFAPYLADPVSNVFVISSDFCHWGQRFRYTYLPSDAKNEPISEGIRQLDEEAMQWITGGDVDAFHSYLKKTGNTICGRHPIGILLNALQELKVHGPRVKFVHYAQSSKAKSVSDSSVSYAAAVASLEAGSA